MVDDKQSVFKVLILGEGEVGKTSITRQLISSTIPTHYKATIGPEQVVQEFYLDH